MLAAESNALHAPHTGFQSAEPSLPTAVADAQPIVYLIVDDASERESISLAVLSAGWQPQAFQSAREFLACPRRWVPSCLLIGHTMPGLNGLELQKLVAHKRPDLPVVFVTGCTDLRVVVQAMQAGAVEFLTKPPLEKRLIGAIAEALERSEATLDLDWQLHTLRCRYESLSRREQEVMELVVAGLLNKQVGGRLDISEITVKAHRGRAMRKMEAKSLPALVAMAARLTVGGVATGGF
jgi:FixJ family two-component response regulator